MGEPTPETLVDRLRGRYAVGKGDPPEFGYRQFDGLPAINREAADEIETLRARVLELERGEYICKKCGLRKDSEFTPGDF